MSSLKALRAKKAKPRKKAWQTLDNPAQNTFEGRLKITGPGNYQVTVYAYNPKTGNTGVEKINYVIIE